MLLDSGDHRTLTSRRAVLSATGSGVVTALSGCLTRGQESGLEGEIRADGSNTVLPFTAGIAEEFQWRNNRVRIPVRGSGTGAGFQRFCTGETDVQSASRRILDEPKDGLDRSETQFCADNDIEWIELEALLDGIAVWVSDDNEFCDSLTVEQLHELWRRGSEINRWSDLDSDWPDEEITLYGRDSASGTFDFFTRTVNGEIGDIRSDYNETSDTNVIVRGVRGNEHAIGFGGAGYFYENEDDLALVGIDAGDGPVEPTPDSIESGDYHLSRPMFLYIRSDQLHREELARFAQFLFERDDEDEPAHCQRIARRVGYYAIPDEEVERQYDRIRSKIAEER